MGWWVELWVELCGSLRRWGCWGGRLGHTLVVLHKACGWNEFTWWLGGETWVERIIGVEVELETEGVGLEVGVACG